MTDVGTGSAASRALGRARDLDAADPLRAYPDRFVSDDPDLVYLDGNSLGRLPRATVDRLERVIRAEWGGELVRGWDHWLDEPLAVGERIGRDILGARSGETIVSDSTTVNLYKLATAALDARPDRTVVVATRDEFPTDRYVLEGLADRRRLTIRWLARRPDRRPDRSPISRRCSTPTWRSGRSTSCDGHHHRLTSANPGLHFRVPVIEESVLKRNHNYPNAASPRPRALCPLRARFDEGRPEETLTD